MTRSLAFLAALLLTAISVSSACLAGAPLPMAFNADHGGEAIQLAAHHVQA